MPPFHERQGSWRTSFANNSNFRQRIEYVTNGVVRFATGEQRQWRRQSWNLESLRQMGSRKWRNWREDLKQRRWITLTNGLIVMWVLLLAWGENWVFKSNIKACKWESWEEWPAGANPHHLVLLADPQLIDPHTYAGRPWPLQLLTEMHTDNYLKRSYIGVQRILNPDTVMFLGDLTDGGREWATLNGTTDDPAWAEPLRSEDEKTFAEYWKHRYGDSYWMEEFQRFGSIFFKHWYNSGDEHRPGQRGRKIISTLPGNHDFGFGTNVREFARKRFQAYFGETNRVDVVGNHTIVSVDGLSLSARVQPRPNGLFDPAEAFEAGSKLAKEVEEFLHDVQAEKRRAVARELRYLAGEMETLLQPHVVVDTHGAVPSDHPTLDRGKSAPAFPTILLTHVPLYRDPGTPCGPLREHWPPANPAVAPDIRNGIRIARGYQYQNVLGEADSADIVKSVGDVVHVFSGDDHDYCEIVHPEVRGGVKEITVKSMSWAMGVRKPGFMLVSMWNPIDKNGVSLPNGSDDEETLQTHLCIQPNQLSIFILYLLMFCFSILVLVVRSATILAPNSTLLASLNIKSYLTTESVSSFISKSGKRPSSPSVLPGGSSNMPSYAIPNSSANSRDEPLTSWNSNSSTSSTASNGQSLAPRSVAARTRSVSPGPGYGYNIPVSQLPTPTRTRTNTQSEPSLPPLVGTNQYTISEKPGRYTSSPLNDDQGKKDDAYFFKGRNRGGSLGESGFSAYIGGNNPPPRKRGIGETAWLEFMGGFFRILCVVGLWYVWLWRRE